MRPSESVPGDKADEVGLPELPLIQEHAFLDSPVLSSLLSHEAGSYPADLPATYEAEVGQHRDPLGSAPSGSAASLPQLVHHETAEPSYPASVIFSHPTEGSPSSELSGAGPLPRPTEGSLPEVLPAGSHEVPTLHFAEPSDSKATRLVSGTEHEEDSDAHRQSGHEPYEPFNSELPEFREMRFDEALHASTPESHFRHSEQLPQMLGTHGHLAPHFETSGSNPPSLAAEITTAADKYAARVSVPGQSHHRTLIEDFGSGRWLL